MQAEILAKPCMVTDLDAQPGSSDERIPDTVVAAGHIPNDSNCGVLMCGNSSATQHEPQQIHLGDAAVNPIAALVPAVQTDQLDKKQASNLTGFNHSPHVESIEPEIQLHLACALWLVACCCMYPTLFVQLH